MNRDEAWELLCEYTKSEALRRHALAVEAVMRAAARKYGGDEETWGIVGLLHDFDYEQFPAQHPRKGKEILEARGVPAEIIYAIQCHADFTGYERRSMLDKMIFAVDELTGFIVACTLVRPNKSLSEVDPKSVRKKLKDKSFARSVVREDIWKGIEEVGVDIDVHMSFVVEALKPLAAQIGVNP